MKILNSGDILETIEMLTAENLDVRTVTMGISLLDCIDPDGKKACEKIYNKITRLAGTLVPVVNKISADYGIPIVNKRISVTPIAMLLGAAPDADPVWFAKTLDAAAKAVGVNFIGGYGALVHKGFSAGDVRLIESIPRALAETDLVCSSVNIGSTKSGINMDAVGLMGRVGGKHPAQHQPYPQTCGTGGWGRCRARASCTGCGGVRASGHRAHPARHGIR